MKFKELICEWFHGGGDIKRDVYDQINWQCRKCGRWAEPVSKQTEQHIIDIHVKEKIQQRRNVNVKISESPYNMTEAFVVRFWYKKDDGYFSQTEEIFYADSKYAHDNIRDYAKKTLGKHYNDVKIISVTYC